MSCQKQKQSDHRSGDLVLHPLYVFTVDSLHESCFQLSPSSEEVSA